MGGALIALQWGYGSTPQTVDPSAVSTVSRPAHMLAAAAELALPPKAQANIQAADGVALPSLAPMLEPVTPAVVNIYTKQVSQVRSPFANDPIFRRFFGLPDGPQERVSQSLGSGVVVDAERGYVLTNHHVIDGADEVSVNLADGRTVTAEFIGSDPDVDIALIRIQADGLTALSLADSDSLRVGDFVVAVGNPFGLGQTVTSGIVSAVGRSGLYGMGYQNFIQTDASINPGNSGGALVNLRGELVGINTASYNPRGSAAGNIGLGFAIPANLAREVMRQLLVYGEVKRGSLGIHTENLTPRLAEELNLDSELRGALISRVYRDSSGESAGLRPGDVIISADDQRVESAQALRNIEGLLPIGKPVKMVVQRNRKEITLTAVMREQPRKIQGNSLDARLGGASVGEISERFRQQGAKGVMVEEVVAESRAAQNGLQPGDRIYGVNGRAVDDLNAFREALSEKPGQLVLRVQRGRRNGDLRLQ